MDGDTADRLHRFSVEDYHRMGEAGILHEDSRVELIRGQVIDMTPIGTPHLAMVNRLNSLLAIALHGRATVSPQNPVRLPDGSEPQPDVTILKWRADYYRRRRPEAQDVLLLIEVSDSSLDYDRNVKVPLYAEGGIPESWIVNLEEWCIEVYGALPDSHDAARRIATAGDVLDVAGVAFQVAELLGDPAD